MLERLGESLPDALPLPLPATWLGVAQLLLEARFVELGVVEGTRV